MIGRGCYVVKMPGHSPWPCMEWECCQALEDAGTMRMWNRRTPNKMFIIYFGTEEQGLVPVVSDEDYAEQPKKKKKVATPQKVMVGRPTSLEIAVTLDWVLSSNRKVEKLRSYELP